MSKRYRPIRHFIETYGFKNTYIYGLLRKKKVGHVRSAPGKAGKILIDENEFIEYLERNRVEAEG